MARTVLNQKNDRLCYGDMLLPKDNYELDFAVGLTYSLDLEALLGVPVSLGMLDEIDTIHKNNPYYLLEAIRRSARKIAIFCNAASMKMPQCIRPVYALLENSIFEILLPGKANFHPKLWVIKYSCGKSDSYVKVITLSRNLTFDRSFDVAVELMGKVGKSQNPRNRPLVDLLNYIAESAPDKKDEIRQLTRAVMHVEFRHTETWDDETRTSYLWDDFYDYTFHPFGIPKYTGKAGSLLLESDIINTFVISPFISKGIMSKFSNVPGRKTLVTRRSSLTNEIVKMFDDVYVARDAVMTD